MQALKDMIVAEPDLWLAGAGLMIGLLFGYVTARTNFCTMGAISDAMLLGDTRRWRAWVLAIAVAIAGTQALADAGAVPLARAMYLAPSLNWFGSIAGGLMFGFGMVLAGGCASRNLVRVGGGDVRALMVLMVMGLFAYIANSGLLAPLRSRLEQATSLRLPGATQGLPELASQAMPVSGLALGALLATALAVYCFADRNFRASPRHVVSGLVVGLCVMAGWLVTGLAVDDLAARPLSPISLTFVRPTADAFDWMQRFTAGMVPGFGVATVLGTVLGGALSALGAGRFRVSTFVDVPDTKRTLGGAALMGVGGVTALGCTVGQGITGVSSLALGSFLALAAILVGGRFGVRTLERWLGAE